MKIKIKMNIFAKYKQNKKIKKEIQGFKLNGEGRIYFDSDLERHSLIKSLI